MLDIDHFKEINDQYGHAAGDVVIRMIATAVQAEARGMDITSRYGGEEFVVLLPQTDREGAWQFAERIRKHIARSIIYHEDKSLSVTISLGVAIFDPQDNSYNEWLARTDQALYRAKKEGRNKTVIAQE
jgi:diguanylate cyclase (GGDEF)-like protein